MTYCYISNQIAKHCDEETKYCPECDSELSEGFIDSLEYLECDNDECDYCVATNEYMEI